MGTSKLEEQIRHHVAVNVRRARERQGFSQAELAARVGMSRPMITRIENAQSSVSMLTFAKLCNALSVKPAALLKGLWP